MPCGSALERFPHRHVVLRDEHDRAIIDFRGLGEKAGAGVEGRPARARLGSGSAACMLGLYAGMRVQDTPLPAGVHLHFWVGCELCRNDAATIRRSSPRRTAIVTAFTETALAHGLLSELQLEALRPTLEMSLPGLHACRHATRLCEVWR